MMRMPRILSWFTPQGAGIAFIALVSLQVTYLLLPYRRHQGPFHSSYYPRLDDTTLKFFDNRSP